MTKLVVVAFPISVKFRELFLKFCQMGYLRNEQYLINKLFDIEQKKKGKLRNHSMKFQSI